MPTIREKLNFNFDGIWSEQFGLISINVAGGMFEETLVSGREVIETRTRGNRKPMFHSIESSPIEFQMTIAFTGKFIDEKIDDVIRWLFVDYYKPLYFEGREDKLYYCIPVGDSSIVHNGLNEGYFTILMRCNSSSVYSSVIITDNTIVSDTRNVTIKNIGHYDIYPEISIKKTGSKGDISIQNMNDVGSGIFYIRDLAINESIYLNCEKEIIESNLIGVSRYDNINGNFTRFLIGDNLIKIKGSCEIQFRFQHEFKF